MLKDWCSKIGCALKHVIGDIRIEKKVTDVSTSDTDVSNEEKNDNESVPVKKEQVEIKIHKPIYEYSHGKKFKKQPTWIVIHYTACINVSAKSMCRAMKNNTAASSHFYIDEKDIYAAVPLDYIAWHVGDGKCKQPSINKKMSLQELSKYKSSSWRYDLAASSHLKWQSNNDDFLGNSQSIGVDICVKKKSNKTNSATDTDWYFDERAVDNTAKLVAYLANVYNIDDSHIITHCMATGKLCPQPFVWPPEVGDVEWEKFKTKVSEYVEHEIVAEYV